MLNVESKLSRMWAQAACAALESGKSGEQATIAADYVALAYATRFGKSEDGMVGSTINLRMAVEFFERSRLIGQIVTVLGYVDLPPMAKIKDFSDGTKFHQDMVLVAWQSSAPVEGEEETWVQIDKLALVKDLDSLCT